MHAIHKVNLCVEFDLELADGRLEKLSFAKLLRCSDALAFVRTLPQLNVSNGQKVFLGEELVTANMSIEDLLRRNANHVLITRKARLLRI